MHTRHLALTHDLHLAEVASQTERLSCASLGLLCREAILQAFARQLRGVHATGRKTPTEEMGREDDEQEQGIEDIQEARKVKLLRAALHVDIQKVDFENAGQIVQSSLLHTSEEHDQKLAQKNEDADHRGPSTPSNPTMPSTLSP